MQDENGEGRKSNTKKSVHCAAAEFFQKNLMACCLLKNYECWEYKQLYKTNVCHDKIS